MRKDLTREETALRLRNFCARMDIEHPDWDTALFVSRINQYYFTGTMQDGLLIIRPGGALYFFVRRSLERAADESPLETVYPMTSYRDAAAVAGADLGKTYAETEIMPLALYDRLKKYFRFAAFGALDRTISAVRAVKTPYELAAAEESGKLHHALMIRDIPALLREGMSETDLCARILERMYEVGYHGANRFQMFQTDIGIGQIGFGVSSLYPTNFDGPGGHVGLAPNAPVMGSRERKLRRGDTVFVDIGFGIRGYNTDKSQAYIFGAKPTAEMVQAQRGCVDIQRRIAASLVPGARPSDIYRSVMESLSPDFKRNFMGFGDRRVKFLGHGIGLHVDETPVIAEGFDEPLEENMLLAVEPKKGVAGVGLLGVEDTYAVCGGGARCLTGGGRDIIEVD